MTGGGRAVHARVRREGLGTILRVAVGFTPVDDDLYRELILDHYRNPRRRGELDPADGRLEAENPLCGDEITLTWRIADGRVSEVAFSGGGCSISQASASMLFDSVAGLPVDEALDLARRYRGMLVDEGSADDLGDLEALQGVRAYPVRIKCALLSCNALIQALSGGAEVHDDHE